MGALARNPSGLLALVRECMARIAIIYCKRIKDYSCIACAKCYKAMDLKDAEFAQYDEMQLVAMTDCGDCPAWSSLGSSF